MSSFVKPEDVRAALQIVRQLGLVFDPSVLLGSGTYANVYAARRASEPTVPVPEELPAEVAVKVGSIRAFRSNQHVIDQLLREVEIHKNLRHPNITRLYYSEVQGDVIVLVLEKCDLSLQAYVNGFPRRTEAEVRGHVRSLASALYYLGTSGISHRDLSWGNVLCVYTSERRDAVVMKISDFGAARIQDDPNVLYVTVAVGTPIFRAPEITLNIIPYSGLLADIWSFGALAFYMLTGRCAVGNVSNMEELKTWFNTHTQAELDAGYQCSEICRNFFPRVLQVDPKLRLSHVQLVMHPWMLPTFRAVVIRNPGIGEMIPRISCWDKEFDFVTSSCLSCRWPQLVKMLESELHTSISLRAIVLPDIAVVDETTPFNAGANELHFLCFEAPPVAKTALQSTVWDTAEKELNELATQFTGNSQKDYTVCISMVQTTFRAGEKLRQVMLELVNLMRDLLLVCRILKDNVPKTRNLAEEKAAEATRQWEANVSVWEELRSRLAAAVTTLEGNAEMRSLVFDDEDLKKTLLGATEFTVKPEALPALDTRDLTAGTFPNEDELTAPVHALITLNQEWGRTRSSPESVASLKNLVKRSRTMLGNIVESLEKARGVCVRLWEAVCELYAQRTKLLGVVDSNQAVVARQQDLIKKAKKAIEFVRFCDQISKDKKQQDSEASAREALIANESRVTHLEQQLASAHAASKRRVEELEHKADASERQVAELRQQNSVAKAELERKISAHAASERHAVDLKQQALAAKAELDRIAVAHATSERRVAELERKLAAAQANAGQIAEQTRAIEEMQAQLQESFERESEAQAQIDALQQELSAQRKQMARLEKDRDDAQFRCNGFRRQTESLNAAISKLQEQIHQLRSRQQVGEAPASDQ